MAATSPDRCHAEFAEAFNVGDLDALCDMYEPDAVYVPGAGAQPIRGISAIRKALADYLAMKPKMEIETVFAHQNGELALLRSKWTISATADGSAVERSGNSSEVIRRQADGTWRQIIDHPYGAS
jgi:uncharacterized protein (TIGR02246 family)